MSEGILTRIAAGEIDAVDECLAHYGGLVWALARKFSSSKSEAEDAVQEIFLELWRNAARFNQAIASEVTFVAMIARRRLIDRRRKLNRTIETTTISAMLDGGQSTPYEIAEFHDDVVRLRDNLLRLKPQEKQVIELSINQGLTNQQISEQLGLPVATVKTHARRGLIRLRELFSKNQSGTGPASSASNEEAST
jgi:RNA polymerase sigma factor (sigma-70 family)